MSYPKLITRAVGIGAVQVQDEAEEKQLLADWAKEQATKAEEAAKAAKAEAEEAVKAAKAAK